MFCSNLSWLKDLFGALGGGVGRVLYQPPAGLSRVLCAGASGGEMGKEAESVLVHPQVG